MSCVCGIIVTGSLIGTESATVFSATLPDKDSGLALSSDSAAARNEFTRWRGVAVERAVLW